jgi:hypothetical protein
MGSLLLPVNLQLTNHAPRRRKDGLAVNQDIMPKGLLFFQEATKG